MAHSSLPEPVPGREADFVADLFAAFAELSNAQLAEEKRLREERHNRPEARAARSERSRKAAATRRIRREAELAVEAERDGYDRLIGAGPWCEGLDFHPVMGEVRCYRQPDHDGDCDDLRGHTWDSDF